MFFTQHESLNEMQDIRVKSEWDGFAGLIERLDQLHTHRNADGGGTKQGFIGDTAKGEPRSSHLAQAEYGALAGQDQALKKTLSALEAELQAYARRKPRTVPSARRPVEGYRSRSGTSDISPSRSVDFEFVKLALEFVRLVQAKQPSLTAEIELLRGELAEVASRISKYSSGETGAAASSAAGTLLLHKVEAISQRIDGVASSKSIDSFAERLAGVETQLNAVAGALASMPPPLQEETVQDLATGLEALKSTLDAKLPSPPAGAQDVAEVKSALFESFAKLQAGQDERLGKFEDRTERLPKAIAAEILEQIERAAGKYDSSVRLEAKLNELVQDLAKSAQWADGQELKTRIAAEIGEKVSKLIERQEEETGYFRQSLGFIEAEISQVVTKMTRLEAGLLLPATPIPGSCDKAEPFVPMTNAQTAEVMPVLFAGTSLGLIEPGGGYPNAPLALPETENSQLCQSGSSVKSPAQLADARLPACEYDEGLSRQDFIAAARKASKSNPFTGQPLVLPGAQNGAIYERDTLGLAVIERLKRLMKLIKKPSGLTLLALLILSTAYNHLEDGQVARKLDPALIDPPANNAVQTSRPLPEEAIVRPQSGEASAKRPVPTLAAEVFDRPVQSPGSPVSTAPNSQQIAGAVKIAAAVMQPSAQLLVPASPGDSAAGGFSSAFLEIKRQAEAGNTAAQYQIAQIFASGQGAAQDFAQAMDFFERAAKQGFAPAQFRLASIYEKGLGTEKSSKAAAIWYERAAEKGNVHAMHNLGVLLAEGLDGRPDYAKAAFWFAEAAAYGEGDSQFNLAVLLGRGLGMPRDLAKSYAWFAIAAALGDAEAAKKRDETGLKLSMGELQAAHNFAQSYLARPRDQTANDAGIPAGGFKSATPVVAKNSVF